MKIILKEFFLGQICQYKVRGICTKVRKVFIDVRDPVNFIPDRGQTQYLHLQRNFSPRNKQVHFIDFIR